MPKIESVNKYELRLGMAGQDSRKAFFRKWHLPKLIPLSRFERLTRSRRWLLLSGMSLGFVLLLGVSHRLIAQFAQFESAAPSVPISAPSPIARVTSLSSSPSPRLAAPPAASPSPTAKRATTGKQQIEQAPEPTLTQEQQAAQQQAIAELEASIPTVDSLVEMKVAIEVNVSSATVGVSNEALLLDGDGNRLDTLSPGTSYTAQADGSSISFNGSALPSLIWIEPPVGSLFYLGDRPYRGRLLLAVENGRLWVVNVVSLRNYLYSVVASEVSANWNVEALKAQAVAARSYALTYYFEPVNTLYDLGDDEYFQVYSGTNREDDRIRQAVDATAGEFVSYRGEVVESLYAASDDIVKEAFQGQGMSQLGALGLAEQGYTYKQILANYYPNTSVGGIAQDF
ncbi:SpoIID/LytB domain-containing protein [Thermocoleostomius sinensis]|uniref:SpoIID/LytB domain-containing protein n=1 Tax=Thermocoleostomius sinensis A174 TaxID=2016057 RepID=A0A9E8ZCJ1_9CYAN|nr:SpoIID/LytB domain-containing protein [Thermocoleostomius sinensis]WAL60397.1 SpoIID/LytB domain-containing protein [Thermocoleostomius sinensis A174]